MKNTIFKITFPRRHYSAAPTRVRHPPNRILNRKVLTLLSAKKLRRMRNRNSRAWLRWKAYIEVRGGDDRGSEDGGLKAIAISFWLICPHRM